MNSVEVKRHHVRYGRSIQFLTCHKPQSPRKKNTMSLFTPPNYTTHHGVHRSLILTSSKCRGRRSSRPPQQTVATCSTDAHRSTIHVPPTESTATCSRISWPNSWPWHSQKRHVSSGRVENMIDRKAAKLEAIAIGGRWPSEKQSYHCASWHRTPPFQVSFLASFCLWLFSPIVGWELGSYNSLGKVRTYLQYPPVSFIREKKHHLL